MKIFAKISAVILLLFNGIGAFYGSLKLISDPSGMKLQLPLSFLDKSPFNDYFIPGIVLFCVNGLFSMLTLFMLLINNKNSHWYVIIQGTLLSGWILIQMIMLQMFYAPLHGTFLAVGVLLLLSGLFLWKKVQK
jgi:hypothetical protein